jgi:hypothetical protein
MRVTPLKGLLVALAIGGGFVPARGARAAADDGAVAILPLDIVGNVPAGRPALEAAVARGLAVLSGPTMGAAETAGKLASTGLKLPCADGGCWSAAGRAAGARYLVAGTVERKGPLFEVLFRLIDAPAGRLLATEKNGCEVADCSVAELCRQVVRELARQTLGNPEAPSLPPVSESATPPHTGMAGSAGAQSSLVDRPQAASRVAGFVPVVAIAAGVAALGAGAYYLKRDGDCRNPDLSVRELNGTEHMDCSRLEDTLWGGLGFAAGGAALVTTGVLLAVFRGRQGEAEGGTQVSIGPGTLLLSGRF